MLAIKECLIREGVLNLTSTANHGSSSSASRFKTDGGGAGEGDGDGGNNVGGAGASNISVYRNNCNANGVSNNLRTISANYTYSNDNRNNRKYDVAAPAPAAAPLALDTQLASLREQKSVDTTHSHNTNTNNEKKSPSCSQSSASATAKSSCQQTSIYDQSKQQQQQQKQQRVPSKQQTVTKSSARYQGVHPHFHHHTTPAYYTDVNLHIHTPKANDVAALNENYQSVYNTPSNLVNESYFPKTSTATVVPPPIGTGTAAFGRSHTISPTAVAQRDREQIFSPVSALGSNPKNSGSSAARAAFFRGGSADSSGNNERKSSEHFTKSSPAFGHPIKKGEFNVTSYTPYDITGSSFVVCTQSSDCSKDNNQLDNTIDTYKTEQNSDNIPITSPISAGNTSASASASASGRSRHSNRFAGKRRAVRVRSESRPISALYDIICKEKGLDIGTSTTNDDESSSSPSNADENHCGHSKRSNNSKERCRQRSSSRNSNRRNSNDYTEISNCLTAFVANSLSNYLGGALGHRDMDHAATVASACGDRSKRAHKSRTPNSQKSGSKKRKDLGKSKTAGVVRSASDEEPYCETSEDSNERRAHALLSPRSKHRTDCCRRMNGTDKASSLPPRLHGSARTYAATKQASHQHQHKESCKANADSNTSYPIVKQCPVHCRCHLECEYQSSSAHRPPHYPLEYHHQSSLPPNLSSGPCSSIRSPSTADDESLMVVNSLGYSPDKLYIEPVNMTLSSMSAGAASGKHANSSSSGVVIEQPSSASSARSIQRISRAQQRRLREELRRHTDLPQLDSLSPTLLSSHLVQAERALSEDEGVAGVMQQTTRATKARRFINRPSRTPSRGRTGNSVNGSPHPVRRTTHTHSAESSSSPSSPAPNRRNAAANDSILISPAAPTLSTVTSIAGVTIEDVGSASSGDHVAHIKLSPLQIMTNSATPATELRPPANGCVALDKDVANSAETPEMREVNPEAGTANIGVQVVFSAAEALHRRKYDAHTHKTPSNTITLPITKTTTNQTASAIISNKPTTALSQQHRQQHQKPLQANNKINNHSSIVSHNKSTNHHNCNGNSNSSYAMPTETFMLKQKAAMLAGNGAGINSAHAAVCAKKKPLSPLQILSTPKARTTTAHQLSHQYNAQQTHRRQQSPLLGAPMSPLSLARSPLSPCSSPHYVRPTKASRLRAAALDKKKYEDESLQRSGSPSYVSIISPRPSVSPKHQSPRLSTSSPSDSPRVPVGSESDTKFAEAGYATAIGEVQSTSSPTAFGSKQLTSSTTSTGDIEPASSPTVIGTLQSSSSIGSPTTKKKLIPTVSVSVKQNLSEMQFNSDINASGCSKKSAVLKQKKPHATPSPSTECTAKFTRSSGRLSAAEESETSFMLKAGKSVTRPRTSAMKSGKSKSTNDLKPGSSENSPSKLELGLVNGATPDSPMEDRDKSSKRKSNLNRSLNDEATVDSDDSLAARRRRRRELGLVRQLVPSDDLILREMLLPHQNKLGTAAKDPPPRKSSQTELGYHMEMARRGWDLVNPSVSNRARSETATSKPELNAVETLKEKPTSARTLARRSDTLHLGELRKLRSNDVNRKMNERTKSDLAEIKKIAEQANVEMAMMASGIATELAEQAVIRADDDRDVEEVADRNECVVELATPARYGMGSRAQTLPPPPPAPSFNELELATEAKELVPSPVKHATFVQEDHIYNDPEASDQVSKSVSNSTMASGLMRQRILKARSMERDAGHEPPKLSPILRRRSTDDPTYMTVPTITNGVNSTPPSITSHNHIVSILKKKDLFAGESSSASSNASPVTFSANVVDTPTTKQKRAGILKKRSSLDESRYYSRSHSPDERSILIKSARRNSLEETAGLQQQQQHGILKQSSYESSKSDGCPSATEPHPHGILKKKDSTSTPSDGGTHFPKHVSISQAVKMAAAELCRETADSQFATAEHEESGYTPSNEEYEIRPILKLESASSDDAMRPPKPILKKKSSGDSDEYEIRPILKTSRKSSREEFDLGGSLSEDGRHYSEPPPPVRPILKTDSPSKRRSLGGGELEQEANSVENASDSSSLLKRRTRSLERQEPPVVDLAAALNAIATSQAAPVDFVSTPVTTGGSISVAERIKNMEKFLSSNGGSPSTLADANTSWESPLQGGMTPRLLKPSAIRRDMYRDRYKTQPVTNDEKMLFKATASPLDTSATSAFKPTKSLDVGLNYTTFAHLNAPSAASSVSPGSSYTLARCSTQPLHSQHYNNAGAAAVSTHPLRAAIGRLNSLSDSYNNSISEQLTLSVGSDSERIFEMSGIEEPETAAVQSEGGEAGGGTGLTRQNSVRARANMFQQLQEQTKSTEAAVAASATAATALSREEQTSPRRAPRQLSPTPAVPATTPTLMNSSITNAAAAAEHSTSSNDEPKTPQNPPRTDEEIEPTSLPVSERLRFFTNLTEAASRSASSSYTRSPSQRYLSTDRCGSANSYNNHNSFTFTPRSSYNGSASTSTSSASVTPTPMECYSPPLSEPQLISINEIDSALPMVHNDEESAYRPPPSVSHETSAFIKLTKSSSQTLLPSALAQRLAMSAPASAVPAVAVTSPSALTPVARRIKMKTIGKLLLPHTFLNNERNSQQNNNNNNLSGNFNGNFENGSSAGSAHNDTCDNECSSIEAGGKPLPPLKKIGKIKSPFIENCLQMQQKHHQLNSKCMKYDHKSTPHNNAFAALENNGSGGGGGERDANPLPPRKPLQNGNAGLPPPRVDINEDNNADSGKENTYCDTSNAVPALLISPSASTIGMTEQSHSPVVEMRKKFARIISNSSLTSMPQRHSALGINAHDSGSANVSVKVNGNGNSSAPTTPRNSIIDEKFAKYFGLAFNNSHDPVTYTTATNKAVNGSERSERTQLYAKNSRLQGASEKSAKTSNYPPLPPPDFCHTTNGASHCTSQEIDSMAMETSAVFDAHSTPLEAVNRHVRSTFETSPAGAATDSPLVTLSTAILATANGTANALQRRRDMAKRQRANTTNVTFTPPSSGQVENSQSIVVTPSAGRARVLRARALTLTHGVPLPLPEVKRFEDIVVTKEEFQLASKEFERIFLGII